jgi:hypothetical protein
MIGAQEQRMSWQELSDDTWMNVLARLQPSHLSQICFVNKRLYRLSTLPELFAAHYAEQKGISKKSLIAASNALSWKILYRNLYAFKHGPPSRVRSQLPNESRHLGVILLAAVPPTDAVFYQHSSDTIVGLARTWSRPRGEVCSCSGATLLRAVIVLGGSVGGIGFVSEDAETIVFLCAATGRTTRTLKLSTRIFPLSWHWTERCMRQPRVCVRGGISGDKLVFAGKGGGQLFVVCSETGELIRAWTHQTSGSTRSDAVFARLVRSPCLELDDDFTAIGIVNSTSENESLVLDILDIATGLSLLPTVPRLKVGVFAGECILDVVASICFGIVETVACRILSRIDLDPRSISLAVYSQASSWALVLREVLRIGFDPGEEPSASEKFACLPNSAGFVNADSLKISVFLFREQRESSIAYAAHTLTRDAGDSFVWSHVGERSSLTACSSSEVSFYDLNRSGRGSFAIQGDITNAFTLSNHAVYILTSSAFNNVHLLHYDRACRSPFPECCSR